MQSLCVTRLLACYKIGQHCNTLVFPLLVVREARDAIYHAVRESVSP
jgi:hypothetical protein